MPKTDSERRPSRGLDVAAKGDFGSMRLHSALARFTTSRWSKLFGYGALIVACRAVRTLIQA